jgi:hypothetical protein
MFHVKHSRPPPGGEHKAFDRERRQKSARLMTPPLDQFVSRETLQAAVGLEAPGVWGATTIFGLSGKAPPSSKMFHVKHSGGGRARSTRRLGGDDDLPPVWRSPTQFQIVSRETFPNARIPA